MVVQSRKSHAHSTLRGDVPSRMAADLAASAATARGDGPATAGAGTRRPAHVGIVGAGVAGLRCADVLLRHGVRVTILEGRTRVGGRLAQAELDGHTVDLGPNWIHGTKNNPIYDLIRETGTQTSSFGDRQAAVDARGARVPDDVAAQCGEILWDTIGEAFRYSNEKSAEIPADDSLMDFIAERAPAAVRRAMGKRGGGASEDEGEVRRRTELVLAMAGVWGDYVGAETARQSLRFLWLEECLDGENPFCAGTFSRVLDAVSRPAREGAEIKLGCKVVKMVSDEGGGKVTARTEKGEEFSFDELVVTAPLGWLKRNLDSFEPRMPARFEEAVSALGYGSLDKVYISFPHAFWDAPEPPPLSTSRPAPSPSSSTLSIPASDPDTSASSSEASAAPPSSLPPAVTTFLPAYASAADLTHPVTQEAMSLSRLPAPHAHPTLLFYTTAGVSRAITAGLPPGATPFVSADPTRDRAAQGIMAHFRPLLDRLPRAAAAGTVTHRRRRDGAAAEEQEEEEDGLPLPAPPPRPQPSAVLATNWLADELAGRGSYTYFPAGLSRGDEHVRALRRGATRARRVWVAGEHAAPFVALGTLTGAWWSGERVAERILGLRGDEDGEVEEG